MHNKLEKIANEMNRLGKNRQPFAFLIDFECDKPSVFVLDEPNNHIWWQFPNNIHTEKEITDKKELVWMTEPVSALTYRQAFQQVQQQIHSGNTYLLNLTFPSLVHTNHNLKEIFYRSSALYKVYLKDCFVAFSPETFVRIENGIIASYPMKGTIGASVDNAEEILKNDPKEVAEHNTIVDLIRNDLSMVANNVTVGKFKYIDRIATNKGDLLQMSSKITGQLPEDYFENIGTILTTMLPAGSICGAPKKKTVEIIQQVENQSRGYYTGVFGVFDGQNLDSCVLIRYIEQIGEQLVFRSGGGITFMSDCENEYQELIQKVYVPII